MSWNYTTYKKKYRVNGPALKAMRKKLYPTANHFAEAMKGELSLVMIKQYEAKSSKKLIKDTMLYKIAEALQCEVWDIVHASKCDFMSPEEIERSKNSISKLIEEYKYLRENLPNSPESTEILLNYADRIVQMYKGENK